MLEIDQYPLPKPDATLAGGKFFQDEFNTCTPKIEVI